MTDTTGMTTTHDLTAPTPSPALRTQRPTGDLLSPAVHQAAAAAGADLKGPSRAGAEPDVNGAYATSHDAYDHTQMGRFAHVVAFHAGVSEPSSSQMLTERLAEATRRALEADSRVATVELVSLRPYALDIARASVGGPLSEQLQAVVDSLAAADGVIAVTPVFQASYTGLFKSFLDILPEGTLRGAPVLMGATAGTARHSLVTEYAMRPLFTHLKAFPTTQPVFAASEDFGAAWSDASGHAGAAGAGSSVVGGTAVGAEEATTPLASRITRAGGELAQFIERFPRQAPVDAMADFTPMDDLLRRG